MNATIVFFNKVRQEPTLAGKIALLKENRSDFNDMIVRDALDKSITYGVTSKGIEIQPHTSDDHFNGWYDVFHRILERLASRDLTGNAAIERIMKCLRCHNEEEQRFFLQILDRDLNLGISWDTYRSEVMGLNDQFEVALAQHLEKAKGVNPVDGQWFASRKCDGCVSGDTLVEIEGRGVLPISEVVDKKLQGKIKSYDVATGHVVYSDITDWMHNVQDADPGQKEWFLLELKDGRTLKITGNDSLYVKDKGWVRVDVLAPGDELVIDS